MHITNTRGLNFLPARKNKPLQYPRLQTFVEGLDYANKGLDYVRKNDQLD